MASALVRQVSSIAPGNYPKRSTLPEILFITTYPPRECGIATYSQDLIAAIKEKFGNTFSLRVCAIETDTSRRYSDDVKYILPASDPNAYERLAAKLNADTNLAMVFIQHEFGLFGGNYGEYLLRLLCSLHAPVVTTFHTILPEPDLVRKKIVTMIATNSQSIVVMTKHGAKVLEREYGVPCGKITIIPHGTHLVSAYDHRKKTARNHLGNRIVLSTFGLLSPGKSIETALNALPTIVARFPNVLYLIIGKTHPAIAEREGEHYRDMLEQKVQELNLQGHVKFINKYLALPDLLTYLQRTDLYLFTSKDPFQAVSGTFAYAMACGCPVISTPIPHATELIRGAGIIVDFCQPDQLADATIELLSNPARMQEMKLNALHKTHPTAWPNAALAHTDLVVKYVTKKKIKLRYTLPTISLVHIRKMTTARGIIQFSKLSAPDLRTGYTLDDNSRGLVALCRYFQISRDISTLPLINTCLKFIENCQKEDGNFHNYVDSDGTINPRNENENLEDSNGRAVWAIGEFLSYGPLFELSWLSRAETILLRALRHGLGMTSPRARSFVIKGLFFYNLFRPSATVEQFIGNLAEDLVTKHTNVSDRDWTWFEEYMTYGNSVLPEALLCAYQATGNKTFRTVAKACFDFFINIVFKDGSIKVISNQGWLQKGERPNQFGEQPIDVAYTILALERFHHVFPTEGYHKKMQISFDWFMGKNHLHQIIYNPISGGCYDGLEEHHVNLNQGAESTISYLMARLVMETDLNRQNHHNTKRTSLQHAS